MEQAHIALSFAVLALGVVNCGGSDAQMKPEVPSDVTTTTAAAAPEQPARAPRPLEITEPSPSPDPNGARGLGMDKAGAPPEGVKPMAASTWEDSGKKTRHTEEAETFSDAEIVAVIDAASYAERQLAREAVKRAKGVRVRQLAQRVLSDHDDARLERVERLASLSPAENPTSADLKSNALSTVRTLEASSDQDFDRGYVDALAKQERRLLGLLDGELLPQAQNQDLRAFLQNVRTSVSSRLGTAEATHAD